MLLGCACSLANPIPLATYTIPRISVWDNSILDLSNRLVKAITLSICIWRAASSNSVC